MMRVNLEDFALPDGSFDWTRYREAEVKSGERCSSCGTVMLNLFREETGPQQCVSCSSLKSNTQPQEHHSYIRCPHCLSCAPVHEFESNDLYQDGDVELNCLTCEKDFQVNVDVSYSYTSPAAIVDADE